MDGSGGDHAGGDDNTDNADKYYGDVQSTTIPVLPLMLEGLVHVLSMTMTTLMNGGVDAGVNVGGGACDSAGADATIVRVFAAAG